MQKGSAISIGGSKVLFESAAGEEDQAIVIAVLSQLRS
jgi:hypothetical protein